MQKNQNIIIQDDNDIKKLIELFFRNFKLFAISAIIALVIAFLLNRYAIPVYKVSASMLIRDESNAARTGNMNEYLNSNIFGISQKFENELWVLKSSPVIEQTIRNLNLYINYYRKKGYQYIDAYKDAPFNILLMHNHIQPVNEWLYINIQDTNNFQITVKSKNAAFMHFENSEIAYQKEKWILKYQGKFGELIETPDMAFIIQLDRTKINNIRENVTYRFIFSDIASLTNSYKQQLEFNVVQKEATVIEIALRSPSIRKGEDLINELMNVYSQQNLDRKNHIASITIDYIDMQLNEISDSLSQTENNLQSFRSSRQLLNITEQANELSAEYRDLQNQMAEIMTRKRYYDYVAEYIANKENYSEMIVPASMGIQDQLLNNLVAELITAQTQRSNLIQNQQEKNPLVQRLTIQIENTLETISENIAAVRKTTDIAIDEMNKRIRKIEREISRLPKTQRQLGGIERKYKLNDAIYNYLLEKRAEAKITKASNLPDNIIIEPAIKVGSGPISPNKRKNYLFAFILGLAVPFGFLFFKSIVNNKIVAQENLERLTESPVLGKIMHNRKKTNNVVFEFPRSSIAESYRALRTNIEFHFKEVPRKIILVTSTIEGEGKSFNALNLAMSYAQLDRMTLLADFDLRKQTTFINQEESLSGLSLYLTDQVDLKEIILQSPHKKLDFIPSGPIPPNPAELLALRKTRDLFDHLTEVYDCIILDTSPLAQVSDAYLLMDYADIKMIVTRYNFTIKKVFSMIMKDLRDKNVDNTCIVLNDNRIYRDQYGYGYGYNKERKRFFSFRK
jgi:tyrosine-protein kinase Etk/Wzc